MADVLKPEQRRLNMSRIRGRDTKPEMIIRRGLHRLGFRFRLHTRELPGRPDLVLPKYRCAIFVHGCFWHDHGCALCKRPTTRPEFWDAKLRRNKERDASAVRALLAVEWKTLIVWECALRGPNRLSLDEVLTFINDFIKAETRASQEIAGVC